MRRAPAKPVRACILRKWCPVHIWSSTSHFALHTSHSTLHASLFTLHSSRPTLHTALFTLVAEHRGETHSRQKRPQPQPPHTRGTFNRRLQPLYTEKYTRFRAPPASSPKHSPCNIHAAITLGFAASRGQPASLYAHGNTRWQQSCSHSNTIRNRRFNTRIELRTQEQPLVAEHRGGTQSRQKRPQLQPPHTRGTFHRRLQSLYTEKYKVSCSGFLPKTKPIEHSCNHYNAFCSITWLTRISLDTWQHQMTTIMQPFQCDPQPQIEHTHRTTHAGTTTRCRTQRRNPVATETTPAATAAHTRYLSSPAAITLHGKIQGFVLWLPPHKSHTKVSHQSFTPKFHTKVSHQSLTPPFTESILMWCKVWHHPSLSVLLQVKVIRSSEDCFPTSFDNQL